MVSDQTELTTDPRSTTAFDGQVADDHSGTETPSASLADVRRVAHEIAAAVGSVIEGKPEVIDLAITSLFAEGHLLIEDVPGVGKTMLAKALAKSVHCTVKRIQFTPDLMPSDVTGVSVFNQQTREFQFMPGGIFANVVLGDEINRASPKTQSALLEAMEERQVTTDGVTYPLEVPFLVVATQNPIEMEGTYPLPEAQRDRFMMRLSMGYPTAKAEIDMIDTHGGDSALDALDSVTDAAAVARCIHAVRQVHVSDAVKAYAVDIAQATRTSTELRLGASPRAVLHLIRAARASAAIQGRNYVLPDDLKALAVPVLGHRLLLSPQAQISRRSADSVLGDVLARVPVRG